MLPMVRLIDFGHRMAHKRVRFPGTCVLLCLFRRTHARSCSSLPRTIHRLDSANSVNSWAVFFFSPR